LLGIHRPSIQLRALLSLTRRERAGPPKRRRAEEGAYPLSSTGNPAPSILQFYW